MKLEMVANVKATWEKDYLHLDAVVVSEASERPSKWQCLDEELDCVEAFLAALMKDDVPVADAFNDYIHGACSKAVDDLLKWWDDLDYPTSLKQYAMDVLSILAMSAEPERLFSSGRNLLTYL